MTAEQQGKQQDQDFKEMEIKSYDLLKVVFQKLRGRSQALYDPDILDDCIKTLIEISIDNHNIAHHAERQADILINELGL